MMTPAQIRMAVSAAVVLTLCVLSSLAGFQVATYKERAACADKVGELTTRIATLKDEKHQLELAIEKSNQANAVAQAQTQAAHLAQAQAQEHAAELAAFSKSRMDKLEAAMKTATGCSDVLNSYWEIRK